MSIISSKNNCNYDLKKVIKEKWEEKKFFYSFELIECQDKIVHQRYV